MTLTNSLKPTETRRSDDPEGVLSSPTLDPGKLKKVQAAINFSGSLDNRTFRPQYPPKVIQTKLGTEVELVGHTYRVTFANQIGTPSSIYVDRKQWATFQREPLAKLSKDKRFYQGGIFDELPGLSSIYLTTIHRLRANMFERPPY